MRFSNREKPSVNAGSMADIAFLLLVFFLVTAVIPNDNGLNRKLPRLCADNIDCTGDIKTRNLLPIILNNNNEIMINNAVVSISEIKEKAIEFLDNNGDNSCDYCKGAQLLGLSENPNRAIISLQSSPFAKYEFYISIQDELAKAYHKLRSDYSEKFFHKSIEDLNADDLKKVKAAYPFKLSEAQTKNK